MAVGKALMSPPVSARITSALRRWIPGIVQGASTADVSGAICASISVESSATLRRGSPCGRGSGDEDRVLVIESVVERLAQRRELEAQLAERELSDHVWVGGAVDQCREHRAARLPQQVRGDAVELDPVSSSSLCNR